MPSRPRSSARTVRVSASATVSCQIGSTAPNFIAHLLVDVCLTIRDGAFPALAPLDRVVNAGLSTEATSSSPEEATMGASSMGFHEAEDRLTTQTKDLHRAIVSLMEELEAVDWYQQRVDATEDAELREILAHNRDEEKEHASMVLEWIRRHDPVFDANLKKYLFTTSPITERAEASESPAPGGKRWNG